MYSGSLPGSPKPPYTILPSIERKKKTRLFPGNFQIEMGFNGGGLHLGLFLDKNEFMSRPNV